MQRFNYKKFIGGLTNISSKTDWAKDFVSILNLRKVIMYIIIISLVAGIFYWKGIKNTPVEIGKELFNYEQEFILRLNSKEIDKYENPALIKPMNSSLLHYGDWRNKRLGKPVKVEDIDKLRETLKPYGFTNKIIGVMGLGISPNDVSGESGVGYRYARLWKLRTEIVATDKGFYPISVSYKPDWYFSNTSLNIAGGKAWEDGMNRGFFGLNVEF